MIKISIFIYHLRRKNKAESCSNYFIAIVDHRLMASFNQNFSFDIYPLNRKFEPYFLIFNILDLNWNDGAAWKHAVSFSFLNFESKGKHF